MLGEALILSGPPGAGKTTIARLLADYAEPSIDLEADAFLKSINRGRIAPWITGSGEQNRTVLRAVASAAACFARGGYMVIVDGLVGPWFLDTFPPLYGRLTCA